MDLTTTFLSDVEGETGSSLSPGQDNCQIDNFDLIVALISASQSIVAEHSLERVAEKDSQSDQYDIDISVFDAPYGIRN